MLHGEDPEEGKQLALDGLCTTEQREVCSCLEREPAEQLSALSVQWVRLGDAQSQAHAVVHVVRVDETVVDEQVSVGPCTVEDEHLFAGGEWSPR